MCDRASQNSFLLHHLCNITIPYPTSLFYFPQQNYSIYIVLPIIHEWNVNKLMIWFPFQRISVIVVLRQFFFFERASLIRTFSKENEALRQSTLGPGTGKRPPNLELQNTILSYDRVVLLTNHLSFWHRSSVL